MVEYSRMQVPFFVRHAAPLMDWPNPALVTMVSLENVVSFMAREFDGHTDMLSTCNHHLVSSTDTSRCNHLVSSTDTSIWRHHAIIIL